MNKTLDITTGMSTEQPRLVSYDGSLAELLGDKLGEKEYKLIVFSMNKVTLGYVKPDGSFILSDGSQLDEKYLVELRAFNREEELLVRKKGSNLKYRHIVDGGSGEGFANIEYVDDTSKIFGAASEAPKNGFAKLVEDKRKFTLSVPAVKEASTYSLVTRSYITYDAETGLAGYGYYRYVDII